MVGLSSGESSYKKSNRAKKKKGILEHRQNPYLSNLSILSNNTAIKFDISLGYLL